MRSCTARSLLAAAVAAIAGLAMSTVAAHADLTIYSGGAVKSGLEEAATVTKTKVTLEFAPMGPLMKRLADGLAGDVIVLSDDRMAEAAASVDAATITEVGRVAMGVAVHESAALPDISTPEAFKQTLLAVKSIVYIDPTRGTSGAHFAKVIEQLGIADAVKAKATLGTGGAVVEPVGRGEIELGVHQITEILPVKGVKLVGPLPAELQKETLYQGATLKGSAKTDEARLFLAFLRSPAIRATFKAKGFVEAD
jgi:molybdate transport system substrate-binding protein